MVVQLNGKRLRRSAGFSLVEVAMSLAIVGFACVAMLGMLPMGLTSFQRAINTTTEADIVQNLTNDLLLANFSNLYSYNNQTFYYDNEGNALTAVGNSVPAKTIYKAVVTMKAVDNSGGTSSSYAPAAFTSNGVSTSLASGSNPAANLSSAYNVTVTITAVNHPTQSDVFPLIVPNNNL